jgi:serine phosphatase RsbU (regulator of sigma subunit)
LRAVSKIILLLFSLPFFCVSQSQEKIDSLKNAIEKETDKKEKAKTYNLLASQYRKAQDFNKARECFEQCLKLSREINDHEGVGKAYFNLGSSYLMEGKYPKTLDYMLKAIPEFESSKSYDLLASTYNSAAGIYFLEEKLDESEKFYRKIFSLQGKLKTKQVLASSIYNIGLLRQRIKSYDSSLVYLNKALILFTELEDKQGIADSYKGIGNVYSDTKRLDEATQTLQKGLAIMQELDDKAGMSEVYRYLGEVSRQKKNYDEAIVFQKRSLQLARELNFTELISLTAQSLSGTYKLKGDHKNALDMFELGTQLRDTLMNQKSIEQIAELKSTFEVEQQRREDEINRKAQEEIHQTELSKQKTLSWAFAIGGIIVMILGGMALRAYLQKNKANKEISFQKTVIEEKNKNIIDSINYSRNIQQAILPSENYFKKLLPDSFVLYKPKDIVSGDFYFVGLPSNQSKTVMFGVADCTGHGVPGAFLTLLGKTFIQLGLSEKGVTNCALALDHLNAGVSEILNKRSEDKRQVRDGMDIALCSLNYETMLLGFSGAKNNAYVFRNSEIIELKADKHAIGELNDQEELPLYKNQELKIQKGDIIYLFSDGFVDQFGGADGKKFKSKQLKEKLSAMKDVPMNEQKLVLEKIFMEWKGHNEQVDDVCVIGIRV